MSAFDSFPEPTTFAGRHDLHRGHVPSPGPRTARSGGRGPMSDGGAVGDSGTDAATADGIVAARTGGGRLPRGARDRRAPLPGRFAASGAP